MDEVNGDAVDGRRELRKLIEPAFLLAPVERRPPVGDELFEIREIGPVVPARAVDLARETGLGESFLTSLSVASATLIRYGTIASLADWAPAFAVVPSQQVAVTIIVVQVLR